MDIPILRLVIDHAVSDAVGISGAVLHIADADADRLSGQQRVDLQFIAGEIDLPHAPPIADSPGWQGHLIIRIERQFGIFGIGGPIEHIRILDGRTADAFLRGGQIERQIIKLARYEQIDVVVIFIAGSKGNEQAVARDRGIPEIAGRIDIDIVKGLSGSGLHIGSGKNAVFVDEIEIIAVCSGGKLGPIVILALDANIQNIFFLAVQIIEPNPQVIADKSDPLGAAGGRQDFIITGTAGRRAASTTAAAGDLDGIESRFDGLEF